MAFPCSTFYEMLAPALDALILQYIAKYHLASASNSEATASLVTCYVGCCIIGAGCAWLSCTFHLAKTRPDLKITILEANFMTPIVNPGTPFLTELDVPFEDEGNFVVVLRLPNVVMSNATAVEDLVVHGDRITGTVTNWTLVAQHQDSQSCMSPNVITAPVTVSATGNDGQIGALYAKRLVSVASGLKAWNCAMVTGPPFGGIMLSGISAAIEVIQVLDTYRLSK
ncbi:thiazole biosynthetic enzyme [Lactarius psammicola]|nr:thiazole biosynthetic enzyme [Lactarius psammicola]